MCTAISKNGDAASPLRTRISRRTTAEPCSHVPIAFVLHTALIHVPEARTPLSERELRLLSHFYEGQRPQGHPEAYPGLSWWKSLV